MSALPVEQRKAEAEIEHFKAQTEKIKAETAAAEHWRHFVGDFIKIVGAIVLGIGGVITGVTGFQVAEAKKEKAELEVKQSKDAVGKLEEEKNKLSATLKADSNALEAARKEKIELDKARMSAKSELKDTVEELEKFGSILVAAQQEAPPNTDTSFLENTLTRITEILDTVNSANSQLKPK